MKIDQHLKKSLINQNQINNSCLMVLIYRLILMEEEIERYFIFSTVEGSVIPVTDEHLSKVLSFIVVTEPRISIFTNEEPLSQKEELINEPTTGRKKRLIFKYIHSYIANSSFCFC